MDLTLRSPNNKSAGIRKRDLVLEVMLNNGLSLKSTSINVTLQYMSISTLLLDSNGGHTSAL